MIDLGWVYFKLLSCVLRENSLQEGKEQRSSRTRTKKAWQRHVEIAPVFPTAMAFLGERGNGNLREVRWRGDLVESKGKPIGPKAYLLKVVTFLPLSSYLSPLVFFASIF